MSAMGRKRTVGNRSIADIHSVGQNARMPQLKEVQSQLASYLAQVRGSDRHVVCPICAGEGEVVPAKIVATGESILICDECDTIWHRNEEVSANNASAFSDLMEERGLPHLWTELTIGR